MELRNLRNFSIIADCLSISEAASLIHISQPALSRQLKQLEDQLGFVLFDRNVSGVTLTRQGKVFLCSSQKLLLFTADAIREARNIGMQHANDLRVGYYSSSMPIHFFTLCVNLA